MQIAGLLKTSEAGALKAAGYVREVLPFGNKIAFAIKTTEKIAQQTVAKLEKRIPVQYLKEGFFNACAKFQRYAKYSTNPEVAKIEERLAQNGINVRFENDMELATLIEKGLKDVQKEGFDIPKNIFISPFKDNVTVIYSKQTASKAPIVLSKDHQAVTKIKTEGNLEAYNKHGINISSTNDMRGTVFHEIGHWLHFHNIPDEKTCERIWSTVNDKLIVPEVSFYSIDKKNGTEFVAEVFAGLMSGKRYSDYVIGIYQQLHGPMPKSLLKEAQKFDQVV